jgi:monooxygenase
VSRSACVKARALTLYRPEDLDYKDKRVAVIGSGATAITLVPAMLERGAAHMTMIQRSPSESSALQDLHRCRC